VSDLILSLDAQGLTNHLTFLLSIFFDPTPSDAAPMKASSVEVSKGGVDKKKGAAEVPEHIAAVSTSAQVRMIMVMIMVMMAVNITSFSSKSGPLTAFALS
jgi:hypothetical protein